ncbi:amidohydrolase [Halobacillus sp. GSS1]|uniref:amidohydrolase n=1 Tax=Halobacillus sp. GSS1 TaxID=2815919 RepID=UPI001A900D2A|nr:amidohydrolase [Halobacillus sp. GSS1]MBN9655024.1 amidohydrolase [Halobacillus sp. GSS1]
MVIDAIDSFIQELEPQLTSWRRELHQQPELGFLEYETSYKVGKELEKLGFITHMGKEAVKSDSRYGVPEYHDIQKAEKQALENGVPPEWIDRMAGGHTGVVAQWDTGKDGPHLAFRFDIDALPILEASDQTHIPNKHKFRSKQNGVMHACGHDGHTTIGLGLARFIAQFQEHFVGRFTLLFQPAEEGGRGAKAMVDQGWLDEVDQFYSGHIGINSLPVGTIAATTQGFLASSKWNVTFHGQSSHAGMKPEDGRNALLAAATAATQLHAIPRHSEGVSRVNVGKLVAGNGRNIISDRGYMEIETRGESEVIHQFMQKEAKRIIHSTASMFDVSVDIEYVGETERMRCDESLIPFIEDQCQESSLINRIDPVAYVSGSEDASFMMNAVQENGGIATYMLFGTSLPSNHHSPTFNFEEKVLPVALAAYAHVLRGGNVQ